MWRLLHLIFCVLLTFSCQLLCVKGANKSDFYKLHSYLFSSDYKKDVRPVDTDANPLFVYMEFSLLSLVAVAEKEQKLVTNARLELSWSDDHLAWTPSDYGGIQSLMVPQKNVWLPDIVLSNGVTAQTRLGYDELPVRLWADGSMDWEPTLLLSTSCSIVITYFPFDTQQCQIEFQTSISNNEEVDINIDKQQPITLDSYSEDGQWQLEKTQAVNLANDNGKTKIRYTITLTRRRTFYLIYIILPIFFLSLMSSLIFAIPGEEGEKMGTGITVVLAFTVYLTIVADLVPNTSLQVSILGVYLTMLLGLSALSLIVCVFILRLHFRDNSTKVGRKTREMVYILRRITFMSRISGSRNIITPINSSELADLDKPRKRSSLPRPEVDSSFIQEDKLTWQIVACTLDWFCFIFFTTFTIVTTLACMLALELGSVTDMP